MFKNKNKKTEKNLKSLKNMQILVLSLLGIFAIVVVTFGIIILLPTADTVAPVSPLSEVVYITPSTEITVFERCLHCPTVLENHELAEEIKGRGPMILQDLRGFLIGRLDLEKGIDPIRYFGKDRVEVQYNIEQCDQCQYDDVVFMVYGDKKLSFYQGPPERDEIIVTFSEEVLFLDKDKELEYSQGVRMGEEAFYIGMYRNSFGVYKSDPVHEQQPLFIFTDLTVRNDLYFILVEEKPTFSTFEEMVELIEAFASTN